MAGKEDYPIFDQEKGVSRDRVWMNQFPSILALTNRQEKGLNGREKGV